MAGQTLAENLFSNLLAVTILFILGLLVYSRMSGKTLVDMVRDIREMFSDKTEEVVDYVPRSFEEIR